MGKYTTFVGMDVHARSIKASALDVTTGEVFSRSFVGPAMTQDLIEWVYGLPQPAYCAYESGCTGFVLARRLRASNIACDVIAVSTLPMSTKDRKQKCDKLDARAIRREIANPDASHSVVWIPDVQTEAERDLCRLYRHAQDECKRARQRLLMFLMRYGYVWDERTKAGNRKRPSGRAFDAWLRSIRLADERADKVLAALIRQLRSAADEAQLIRRDVRQLAHTEKHKPFVDALRCLKGIDVETAVLAVAEIGDFTRFSSGRKVSCWLGTVPSDSSSGERDRHGRITKAGNKYLRKALIEGWSGAASWRCARKVPPKDVEVSAAIHSMATKANTRLFKRYAHLTDERRKGHNKAKVAVVSELVRWIWVIGLQVQKESPGTRLRAA